ncbi:MAG: hypothetical protein ACKO6N_10450, partial [Myxococcota bacterium]
SADTLMRIAALGINMNWLFTGKGPMLLPDAEGAVQRKKKGTKRLDAEIPEVARHVQRVLDSMSDQWLALWDGVIRLLEVAPEGLTLEELESKLVQFEPLRLRGELERMEQERLIGLGRGRYRLLSSGSRHERNAHAAELRVLTAVRELLKVHMTVFKEKAGGGKISVGRFFVKRGAALEAVKLLWRWIESWQAPLSGAEVDDSEQICFVLSTVITSQNEG